MKCWPISFQLGWELQWQPEISWHVFILTSGATDHHVLRPVFRHCDVLFGMEQFYVSYFSSALSVSSMDATRRLSLFFFFFEYQHLPNFISKCRHKTSIWQRLQRKSGLGQKRNTTNRRSLAVTSLFLFVFMLHASWIANQLVHRQWYFVSRVRIVSSCPLLWTTLS